MEDEIFEKYFERISKEFRDLHHFGSVAYTPMSKVEERIKLTKKALKEILEEIYQKGKDNKFKDIGYLDVGEFYPDNKEVSNE